MPIIPSVPIFIDANPSEHGEVYFSGKATVYNLLHPELGVAGSVGLTYEPKEFTTLYGGLGMGVADGLVFPTLEVGAMTLVGPVLLYGRGEWDVTVVDGIAIASCFYTQKTTIGVEGEVLADFETGTTWLGGGPSLYFLPSDHVWLGFAWYFTNSGEYNPRLNVMLNL